MENSKINLEDKKSQNAAKTVKNRINNLSETSLSKDEMSTDTLNHDKNYEDTRSRLLKDHMCQVNKLDIEYNTRKVEYEKDRETMKTQIQDRNSISQTKHMYFSAQHELYAGIMYENHIHILRLSSLFFYLIC